LQAGGISVTREDSGAFVPPSSTLPFVDSRKEGGEGRGIDLDPPPILEEPPTGAWTWDFAWFRGFLRMAGTWQFSLFLFMFLDHEMLTGCYQSYYSLCLFIPLLKELVHRLLQKMIPS
jgi:hypothetical protein